MQRPTRYLTEAALVAALYYVLTALVFQPISFAIGQIRVAEALMLLPALIPAATPGLFLGCLLANLLNPMSLGPVDIVLGSFATLVAALAVQKLGRRLRPASTKLSWSSLKLWLLPLPTIGVNALVVGSYLPFLLTKEAVTPGVLLFSIASVAFGETLSCYILGVPLLMGLRHIPVHREVTR